VARIIIRYEVVVRRRNGRFLKAKPARSRYAAKKLQDELEEKYKYTSFYFEIRRAP
jgi:hypothetical protein